MRGIATGGAQGGWPGRGAHVLASRRARWLLLGALCSWIASGIVVMAEEAADQFWMYDAKGRCAPFVPLVRDGKIVPCETGAAVDERGKSTAPKLDGIVWDTGGHSLALINGGEAQVGDVINGWAVMEIRQDEVILARDEERLVLRITFDGSKPPEPGASR